MQSGVGGGVGAEGESIDNLPSYMWWPVPTSQIIWIRQTGAHTLDGNKKNVMNHQVIDIL